MSSIWQPVWAPNLNHHKATSWQLPTTPQNNASEFMLKSSGVIIFSSHPCNLGYIIRKVISDVEKLFDESLWKTFLPLEQWWIREVKWVMFRFNVLRKSTQNSHTKKKNRRKEKWFGFSLSSRWTLWALAHGEVFSVCVCVCVCGPSLTCAVHTHYLSLRVTFLANRAWSHMNCPWDSCCQLFWNVLQSHTSRLRWGQRATEGGNPQEGGEEDLEEGKLQYRLRLRM